MGKRVFNLAFSVALLAGTSIAQGQTYGPIFMAEAPVTVPPSGVLVTPPPAPVAVPPSGVLATPSVAAPPPGILVTQPPTERRTIATVPIKRTQTAQNAERIQGNARANLTPRAREEHAAATLSAAMSAPTRPPIDVGTPAPVYDWSGFYIGGNLGFGWNLGSFSDSLGNTVTPATSGEFLGGGQAGFDYEFWGGILIGAEADLDWLPSANNIGDTTLLANPPGVPTGSTASVAVNNRWLITVTGRVGYAWDRVLLYGKGGGAWVGANSPTVTVNGRSAVVSSSYGNSGWTAGLGIEWAFWGDWSARIEYDFVGLNSQTFALPVSVGGLAANDQFSANNRNIQVVNLGTSYKFQPSWW
jgi:outer membrane immunogenic protein